MIEFQPVTFESKDMINHYLKQANYRCCEYNFETMVMWQNRFHASYAIVDDFLVIHTESDEKPAFLAPVGIGDGSNMLDKLKTYCREKNEVLYFTRVVPNAMPVFESRMKEFVCNRVRDLDDYIYNSSDLADLPGKKLHSKRTHLNKFMQLYCWQYEPITIDNIEECKKMNRQWCKDHKCCDDEEMKSESSACSRGLKLFFDLGMFGGVIRVDGKIIALTVASPLFPGSDMLVVHFEKALSGYEGAYTVINQQFAQSVREQYVLLDREEDMGVAGLRKSKLSYLPVMLEPQYDLFLEENCYDNE